MILPAKVALRMLAIVLLTPVTLAAESALPGEVSLIGDGLADETERLQRTIDQCEGLLELPAGRFRLTTPLVVDTTTLGFRGIRGANGATQLIMEGPGPAIKIVGSHQGTASPQSFNEHTWEKERFPVVEGLSILGKHPEADGIALYRTMQCTLQNVHIRNCRYGVHLIERNRNFILANSHIYDGGDTGVFLDHCDLHQVILIGNHISYNKRAGIRQLEGDVHNVQITGNDIEYNYGVEGGLSGDILLESLEGYISEYTLSGNTIQAVAEARGANILIIGREVDPPGAARTITMTGNVIGSREKTIEATRVTRMTIGDNILYGGAALNLEFNNCRNLLVNANAIGSQPSVHESSRRYTDGVLFAACQDSIFSDNILHSAAYGSEAGGGALTLTGCQRMHINDNHFMNPVWRGIAVEKDNASLICDNTVRTTVSPTTMLCPLALGEGNQHTLMHDNVVSPGLTPMPASLQEANIVQP